MPNWALGIDLGSSSTHAAAWTEGRLQLLTVDGLSAVPSTVMLRDETLIAGPAAHEQRLIKPAQIAQDPRRFVGGSPMVLGGLPVSADAALAALLRLFASSGRAAFGDSAPSAVVLTHPVEWTGDQQEVLRDAARAVFPGIEPQLVPEPVAAAVQCAQLYGLAEGRQLAVYGLGAGGFGSAVIGRRGGALRVLGVPTGTTGIPTGTSGTTGGEVHVELTLATIESAHLRADDMDALFLTGEAGLTPLADRALRARFGQRVMAASDGPAVTALGAAQIAGERLFGSPIATPLESPPGPTPLNAPASPFAPPAYPVPVPAGPYGTPVSLTKQPGSAPSVFAPIAMAAFVVLALAGTVILWLV